MTEPLSPAAAAVMIAATNGNFNVVDDPVYKQCIAAALEAVADQVVPVSDRPDPNIEFEYGQWLAQKTARGYLLAIAAELKQ